MAPARLIAWARRIRLRSPAERTARSSRVQCRTMPNWLSVKETKTPMM